MHSLIIFASGKGSNAQAIIDYFRGSQVAKVSLIVSNKTNAGVLEIAERENIPSLIISKDDFSDAAFVEKMHSYKPSLIILAGFLWKIPSHMITAFPGAIVNIHPSLLPKYGGKGMYGHHVHEAVLAAGEQESGITIHIVNEVYDQGDKILQAYCLISTNDNVDTLSGKIHKLEHFFYPRTIEYLLENI